MLNQRDIGGKTQIWIAISVYLIVAIIRKRLRIEVSLYTMLQVLSVTIFERTELIQLLAINRYNDDIDGNHNKLNLFS